MTYANWEEIETKVTDTKVTGTIELCSENKVMYYHRRDFIDEITVEVRKLIYNEELV